MHHPPLLATSFPSPVTSMHHPPLRIDSFPASTASPFLFPPSWHRLKPVFLTAPLPSPTTSRCLPGQPPLHISHLFAPTASPPPSPPLPASIESHFFIYRFCLPSPITSKHLPDQPPLRADHLPMPTTSPTPPFPSPHQPKPIFPSIITPLPSHVASNAFSTSHLPMPVASPPPSPHCASQKPIFPSIASPLPLPAASKHLRGHLSALVPSITPPPSLHSLPLGASPIQCTSPSPILHPISSSPLQPLSSILTSSICFIIR